MRKRHLPRVIYHQVYKHTKIEREFVIDNLLVRIHLIIDLVLVDRPCAMKVQIPFSR